MKSYIIPINPVPASRPRVTRWATYYSKTYDAFRTEFKRVVPSMTPLEGFVKVKQIFHIQIPKSYSKKKKLALAGKYSEKNCDIDNLEKALWDGLNGIAFIDDNQIVANYSEKRWSEGAGYIEFHISNV